MRSFLLIAMVAALVVPARAGTNVKFPYAATVEADEAYVRSGPGSKYYPTGKLRRGEEVVVHRHDPGGWFMIAPPQGSFSWVPAKFVQKTAADRGTITSNNVAVRVGSFESDIRELFQRKLSQDDEIRILGEKMLRPDTGSGAAELWYRIEPPRGEWRWIMGQAVSPPVRADRNPHDDPFESPSAADNRRRPSPAVKTADDDSPSFERPVEDAADRAYLEDGRAAEPGNEGPLGNRPLVRKESKSASTSKAKGKQDLVLDELDRLDARFRSILDKDPLEWDFDQLEHDYQALRDDADNNNIQQMIETRLARIAGYRKTHADEEELARVRAETERRDAELAERQRLQEAQLASLKQPRFDGAGIVERSALTRRGSPRYVLLNPSGKVLAYLAPAPGVNLETWVGRTAGVFGSRVHQADLKSDLITVTRLAPVRLGP